jgi:hypothetical protein
LCNEKYPIPSHCGTFPCLDSGHALIFYHYGIRNLHDSDGYIEGADFLIEQGNFIGVHHIFYSTHIGLLAISRIIFSGEIVPYLIFQCFLSGLGVLLLYQVSSDIFKSNLAGLITALIYLLWWDNIHWNGVAMTESLFSSMTCGVIFLLHNVRSV